MGHYSAKQAAKFAKRASKEATPHSVTGITVKSRKLGIGEADEPSPMGSVFRVISRVSRVVRRKKHGSEELRAS